MRVINVALIRHPMNWITVFLMLIIATFAINAGAKLIFNKNGE